MDLASGNTDVSSQPYPQPKNKPHSGALSSRAGRGYRLNTNRCWKCGEAPEAGKSLHKCARCYMVQYCSKQCQVLDWRSNHKKFCAHSRAERERAIADSEAFDPGNGRRNRQIVKKAEELWYDDHMYCHLQAEFLAWKHRADYPVIKVTTDSLSVDSAVEVVMVPRSQWAEVNNSTPDQIMTFRSFFERSDFDELFAYVVVITVSGVAGSSVYMWPLCALTVQIRHSALVNVTSEEYARESLRRVKHPREAHLHRLTGLIGSEAHLNGQECVLGDEDPNKPDGWYMVTLEGGEEISMWYQRLKEVVRPQLFNFE